MMSVEGELIYEGVCDSARPETYLEELEARHLVALLDFCGCEEARQGLSARPPVGAMAGLNELSLVAGMTRLEMARRFCAAHGEEEPS